LSFSLYECSEFRAERADNDRSPARGRWHLPKDEKYREIGTIDAPAVGCCGTGGPHWIAGGDE